MFVPTHQQTQEWADFLSASLQEMHNRYRDEVKELGDQIRDLELILDIKTKDGFRKMCITSKVLGNDKILGLYFLSKRFGPTSEQFFGNLKEGE